MKTQRTSRLAWVIIDHDHLIKHLRLDPQKDIGETCVSIIQTLVFKIKTLRELPDTHPRFSEVEKTVKKAEDMIEFAFSYTPEEWDRSFSGKNKTEVLKVLSQPQYEY